MLASQPRCSDGRTLSTASGYLKVHIGDKLCDVQNFGAKGDGVTDDGPAIMRAFRACRDEEGGGRILLSGPSPHDNRHGIVARHYISRIPIYFTSSHQEFRIEETASLYMDVPRENIGHDLVSAAHLHHIAVTGSGLLQGRGRWDRDSLNRGWIPKMIGFRNVSSVLIWGPSLAHAPFHDIYIEGKHVEVARVTINQYPAHKRAVTPDAELLHSMVYMTAIAVSGMDVFIHHCNIDTAGEHLVIRANHTVVEKCKFTHGHGAIIGSVCNENLFNISMRNITFQSSSAGTRILSRQFCLGTVEKVEFDRLFMKDVGVPFSVNMYYDPQHWGTLPKTKVHIHNVLYKNVFVDGGKVGCRIMCDQNAPCYNFRMHDIHYQGLEEKYMLCENAFGSAAQIHGLLPNSVCNFTEMSHDDVNRLEENELTGK